MSPADMLQIYAWHVAVASPSTLPSESKIIANNNRILESNSSQPVISS